MLSASKPISNMKSPTTPDAVKVAPGLHWDGGGRFTKTTVSVQGFVSRRFRPDINQEPFFAKFQGSTRLDA